MNSRTVVEILGEEVCVERGAHEDDLQVGPGNSQVFQDQQQEVTMREKNIYILFQNSGCTERRTSTCISLLRATH